MNYQLKFLNYKTLLLLLITNFSIHNLIVLLSGLSNFNIIQFFGYNSIALPYSALTYSFIHLNYEHLFNNMFILCCYGIFLEPSIGSKKMLILYLISSIFSIFIYDIISDINKTCIGSSAAVFSIIGASIKIKRTPIIFKILALLLIQYELAQIYLKYIDNVAHEAHIIGFLIGFTFSLINKN